MTTTRQQANMNKIATLSISSMKKLKPIKLPCIPIGQLIYLIAFNLIIYNLRFAS